MFEFSAVSVLLFPLFETSLQLLCPLFLATSLRLFVNELITDWTCWLSIDS